MSECGMGATSCRTRDRRKGMCSFLSISLVTKHSLFKISRADIIVVGGGNTLFAVDTWKRLDIHLHLKKAMERGVVLSGGSAGAICWFDGGHSDSMDPTSYKRPTSTSDDWKYIRVDGIGIVPGLCCPHWDRTQSNGIPRYIDFEGMSQRHPRERGICISHYAALRISDGKYKIICLEEGASVKVQDVVEVDGVAQVKVSEIPEEGKLEDIFRVAKEIVNDPLAEACRAENPF